MSGDFHKIGNIRGADGKGVPGGGQRGQALVKVGDTDFATGWDYISYSDLTGKVPKEDLPDLGIAPMPVKSEAEMLNLPAVVGNMAIRTDLGKTFVLMEEPASTLGNWLELVTTSDVQSVNGQTGNVQLTKADVGLGNVNNTADSDKPEATTSVRGLMSAADKAKLNNATAVSYANRMVMRDASGGVRHKYVTIDNAPTNNSDAATKSYVDTETSKRVKSLGSLGSGVDLNDLTEDAVGVQTASANAKTELNYPLQSAGSIQVIAAGTMVYQFYTQYHQSQTTKWWRTKYAGTWGDWKQLVDTDMLNTEITAAKKHTDDRFDLVAGGKSVNQLTDWDATRSTVTGIVEGWPKGCPVGGAVSDNVSAGFVKDPVWKLEVRAEGLGYVTQRATLLNSTPKYMIGFAWERVYSPAGAKWSAWACVAGDTGAIKSSPVVSPEAGPELAVRYVNSSSTYPWSAPANLPHVRRIGNEVFLWGQMSSTNSGLWEGGDGVPILAFHTIEDVKDNPAHPGVDWIFPPDGEIYTLPIQGGNTSDNWRPLLAGKRTLNASRYTPDVTRNARWLPFNVSFPAQPINTNAVAS